MKNISKFNKEVPRKDRVIIPIDGDDDAYFIKWSMNNNAILITNDLLRDHNERIQGSELEDFQSWYVNGRCGYIFVDQEFIPDPKFNTETTDELTWPQFKSNNKGKNPREVSKLWSEYKLKDSTKSGSIKPRSRKKNIVVSTEDLKLMSNLSFADKNLELDRLESKIIQLRKLRNEYNEESGLFFRKRDKINEEVKEKIIQVKKLKEKRDKENLNVKQKKNIRNKLSGDLKKSRKKDIGDKEIGKKDRAKKLKKIYSTETKSLEKKQEKAHIEVEEAVGKAQILHEQMIEISELVDEMRFEANTFHKKAHEIRDESNIYHEKYLINVKKKFRLLDMVREEDNIRNEKYISIDSEKISDKKTIVEKPFISDIFHSYSEEEILEELNDLLRLTLKKYKSKTGRREHIVDRGEFRYKLEEHVLQIESKRGYILGLISGNKNIITDSIISEYKLGTLKIKTKQIKK